MNDRAVQSVSEAMLYSANVNAQRYGADVRSDYFTVRGFPADLYLDGLRIPQIASQSGGYSGFVVEPYSLESVEILRGPSSALFGQSNVGGIVNMVSKQPQAEASREIYLRGGSFERKEFGADITGPINNDPRFTYRLNGIFRDSNTSYDLGKNDRIAINPSFAWRPDADTSLVVSGGYLKDDMGQAGVIIPAYGSVLPNPTRQTISRDFSDGDPRNAIYKKEIGYAGYDFEHRFNDTFTLRQNFRYSHMKTDYRNLFTGVIPTKGWDGHTIPRTNYLAQPELDAIAFDTQLESRFDTGLVAHTLLVGFDQQWQRLDNYTASASGPTQDLSIRPMASLSRSCRRQRGFCRSSTRPAFMFRTRSKSANCVSRWAAARISSASVPNRPHSHQGRPRITNRIRTSSQAAWGGLPVRFRPRSICLVLDFVPPDIDTRRHAAQTYYRHLEGSGREICTGGRGLHRHTFGFRG